MFDQFLVRLALVTNSGLYLSLMSALLGITIVYLQRCHWVPGRRASLHIHTRRRG